MDESKREIHVHNDGKAKYQSWSAYVDGSPIYGYGDTEADALDDLKANIASYVVELQTIDFGNIRRVDFKGEEASDGKA